MSPALEKLLLWVIQLVVSKVFTPENIKGLEKDAIIFLKAVALKTKNVVDDDMVEALAIAWGVEY